MTDRSELSDRLDDIEAVAGPTTGADAAVTIVLDAEYVDREPDADNVVLSSNYRDGDADGGMNQ